MGSSRCEKEMSKEPGEELNEHQMSKNEALNPSSPYIYTPQRTRVTSAIDGTFSSPRNLPDSSKDNVVGRERFYSSGNPFVKRPDGEDLDMIRR